MRILIATIISLLIIPVMAADWQGPDDILEAAAKGNPEAQLEMGILYQFGFHMPENKMPALAWYLAAAEQGSQVAAQKSDILQRDMLPTEVEEARQLSQNLSALAVISSSTTSNPDYMPMPAADESGQNLAPEVTGGETASEPEVSAEAMPEKAMAREEGQGDVTQEVAPELLPELGPESAPKSDGPIQPGDVQ